MAEAARVNPFAYSEYTSKPKIDRLAKQIVYGVKTSIPNMNIPGYKRTYGNQRFDLKKQAWIQNNSKSYIKNEFNYRPASANKLPNKFDVSKLLYGYKPLRDRWVPQSIIKRASQIPFVGLKN